MATIENIADDHDMYVSEYYSYVYNTYIENKYEAALHMIREVESVGRLNDLLDYVETVLYDGNNDDELMHEKYNKFLKFIILNGE